mmetsp:Transcript_10837/g.21185  ORF Transcript_10837/g.21185 Transcript_10837/m.21185 type:complete len:217 (+) Transcript_10837:350-1000(+)
MESDRKAYDYLIKFIVVGDSGVGKTCLLLRFTDERFKQDHDLTIGVEFGTKTLALQHKALKLQIWDTAGQESYRSITRSYYRGAAVALLVFDVTSRVSYSHINSWVREIKSNSSDNTIVCLVANKTDLAHLRTVSSAEAQQFAQESGFKYFETSAKTGENISQVFLDPCNVVLERIKHNFYEFTSDLCGVKEGPSIKQSVRLKEKPKKHRCVCKRS